MINGTVTQPLIGSIIGGIVGGFMHYVLAEEGEDAMAEAADGFMWGTITGAACSSVGQFFNVMKETVAVHHLVLSAMEGLLETAVEEFVLILQGENLTPESVGYDLLLNIFTSGENPRMKDLADGLESVMKKLGDWFDDTATKAKEVVKKVFKNSEIDNILKKYNLNSTKDVGQLTGTKRGNAIEELLAHTEYKDWWNCGTEMNGYFPVVDFSMGNDVVSLKTIDPTLKSYQNGKAYDKIMEYIENLASSIIGTEGESFNKILDVRVPEGTINMLNIDKLSETAVENGITLVIKEF